MESLMLYIYALLSQSILLFFMLLGVAYGTTNAIVSYKEDSPFISIYFTVIAFLSMFVYVHTINAPQYDKIINPDTELVHVISENEKTTQHLS